MRIGRLLCILLIALASVTLRADHAAATSVTIAGTTYDQTAFADRVLSFHFQGVLQGGATAIGQAVLGSNSETYADFKPGTSGQYIEVGFDNVIVNNPGNDLAVYDLFVDPDEFNVSLVNRTLNPGAPSVNASIADTGFVNANSEAITVAFFDLDDLGVAAGASINSLFINSPRSTELTFVSSLNGVPESSTFLLLLSGLLGLMWGRQRQ